MCTPEIYVFYFSFSKLQKILNAEQLLIFKQNRFYKGGSILITFNDIVVPLYRYEKNIQLYCKWPQGERRTASKTNIYTF